MKIPKYWAKTVRVAKHPAGRAYRLVCWQWSDSNADEARQRAEARAAELTQKVVGGALLDRYAYGERPIREEITQSIANPNGSEIAVVTRNLYGALVLNSANAMFIDIDFPEKDASRALAGSLQRMLGGRSASQEELSLEHISTWASQHPDLSLRIYRTFGGLRCLIANQTFDPARSDSMDILRALGSDPLYVRLCQAQVCFRARLTPKPWRCGLYTPPTRYPWENAAAETHYRQWEQKYGQAIAPYSVCKWVKQIGPDETHPDVEPVLALHDQLTGVAAQRKLA